MGKKSKTEISGEQLNEFISNCCVITPSDISGNHIKCYHSCYDGSYLTQVGLENELKMYIRFGITSQIQGLPPENKVACIGFNPRQQKWYGWSHRAIYGFGIGYTCKKGDCGYHPMNKEDYIDETINFWKDENKKHFTYKEAVEDGELGVWINWTYSDKIPNKKLRGSISGSFSPYPEKWGKGVWTTKTLEDAKQMAIDFARGVG